MTGTDWLVYGTRSQRKELILFCSNYFVTYVYGEILTF